MSSIRIWRESERCVLDALKVGYRSIDTAQSYFNEEEVGNAIAKSGIPREEIFFTTKVWIEHYGYEEGKIRAIGISNFYVDRMVDFASFNRIKPMINQVELHIHNQQKELKEWTEKYHKTTAQVMLRWHIQRGIVIIPKSTHMERMEENFNVFDFTLSDEDMQQIAELDTAQSAFFSHQDPKMVEWFVNMVEERKKNHDSSKEKKNW